MRKRTPKSNRSRRRRTARESLRQDIFNAKASRPVLPSRRLNRLGNITNLMMQRTYGDPYATSAFITEVANMVPDFEGIFDEFLSQPIDEESFILGFIGANFSGMPIYLVRTGISELDHFLRQKYDNIRSRLRFGNTLTPHEFQRLVAEYVHILDDYDLEIGRNADRANRLILHRLLNSYGFDARITDEETDALLENASPREVIDMILTAFMVHSRAFLVITTTTQ